MGCTKCLCCRFQEHRQTAVYGLNMPYISLKDSYRDLQINYAISYFLSIFNIPCMCHKIRCDEKSCKVLGFEVHLNSCQSYQLGFKAQTL